MGRMDHKHQTNKKLEPRTGRRIFMGRSTISQVGRRDVAMKLTRLALIHPPDHPPPSTLISMLTQGFLVDIILDAHKWDYYKSWMLVLPEHSLSPYVRQSALILLPVCPPDILFDLLMIIADYSWPFHLLPPLD